MKEDASYAIATSETSPDSVPAQKPLLHGKNMILLEDNT